VVLCRYGSIFARSDSIGIGLAVAGAAAFMQYLIDEGNQYAPDLPHHYSMHALGVIVGFSVVFRTNLGWNRYWEAVGQLHVMYSKWGDAFSQIVAFASVSAERCALSTEAGAAKAARIEGLVDHIYNNFIILSALASDRLTHGDTSRMEQRANSGAKWGDQIVTREALREVVDGETSLPEFKLYKDDGRSLSKSFGDLSTIQNTWKSTYKVKAMPTPEEQEILVSSTDRTTVVMYWIIYDLAKISTDIDAAPPIQSRMYQELSNGMLGFNQCVKLADVPFPFPYAQMLTCLLCCFGAFIPVYITCFTKSMIVSTILSFCLFEGIWGLNETAKELENPFGTDENDICLGDFHLRFLDCCNEVFESCSMHSLQREQLIHGGPDDD